jgi:hypothetical protein
MSKHAVDRHRGWIFCVVMAQAMERMHKDMSIVPSGDPDRDFAAMGCQVGCSCLRPGHLWCSAGCARLSQMKFAFKDGVKGLGPRAIELDCLALLTRDLPRASAIRVANSHDLRPRAIPCSYDWNMDFVDEWELNCEQY